MSSHRVPDEIKRNTASTNSSAVSNTSGNQRNISDNLNIVGSKSTTPAIVTPPSGDDDSYTTIDTIVSNVESDDLADLRKPLIEPDNMIDLTVKTLDSQNHPFHVEEDITIRQFKEKISESLHIPPDSQRLIFCGRVLQDDKRLSEYALASGNTVHMVQRAPPQATASRPSREQSGAPTSGRSGIRRSHTFRMVPPNIDRNAMYLGSMAYPADLMEAQANRGTRAVARRVSGNPLTDANPIIEPVSATQELETDSVNLDLERDSENSIQLPQPSASLCASRLNIARRMLRLARGVLTHLETPGSDPPRSTPSPTTVQVSQAVIEVGIAEPIENIEDENIPQEVRAAVAATVSATQEAGVPNITIFRRNPGNRQETLIHIHAEEEGSNASSTGASQQTDRTRADSASTVSESEDETVVINIDADLSITREEPTAEEAPQTSGHSRSSSSDSFSSAAEFPLNSAPETAAGSTSNNETAETNANPGSDTAGGTRSQARTPLAPLAAVLDELNAVQTRLAPFMAQYHAILVQDPTYANNVDAVEASRVFNRTSQLMHHLSHAYHALSDLMVDLNSPPPRYLRCRPILIQHSAVVQAGIPIPIHAEINIPGLDPPNGNNNRQQQNQSVPSENTTSTQGTPGEPLHSSTPTTSPQAAPDIQVTSTPGESTTGSAPAAEANADTRNDPSSSFRHFGFALPETLGGGVEVVMEISPPFTGSFNTNGAHTMSGGNGIGGRIPFAPPSSQVLADIMQAVAGQIMHRIQPQPNQQARTGSTTASETSGTSTATTGTNGTNNAAGQNSQARVNTATHPTTSTQTRSTARPHVQLRGPHMHLGGRFNNANCFDPFLPCNSHHLKVTRVRAGGNNNNNNSASTTSGQGAGGSHASAAHTASRLMNELSQQLSEHRRSRINHLAHQISTQSGRQRVRLGAEPPADTAANVAEPTNTILEFLLTLGRVTYLEDILSMVFSNNRTTFEVIRPTIRDFIRSRLISTNSDNNPIDEAAEFIAVEIQPYFAFLQSEPTINNIDLIASVTSLSRSLFPHMIRIALRDDRGAEEINEVNNKILFDAIRNYVKLFCGILVHSCELGEAGAENVFLELKRFVEEGAAAQNMPFVLRTTLAEFKLFLTSMEIPLESVQPYLKKKRSEESPAQDLMDVEDEGEVSVTQSSSVQQQSLPPTNDPRLEFIAPTVEPEQLDELRPPVAPVHPLEAEPTSPVSAVPVENTERQATLPPIEMDVDMNESVTNIAVGSQPWHTAVPSDWVPIITRDTVRQRRQNSQPPFSDAYVQGLPSKRRKLIASEKPAPNVERAIQEGVRQAVDTVPHREGPAVNQVAAQAAAEPSIQLAYRDQLRTMVRTRLQHDQDFTPEKYPNTDKFFK